MLKNLYTLSEQFKSKKVIVYGINRNSIIVFAKLALNHQVDIHSFWDASGRFVGKSFVNRRIISTEQLNHMDDAIVIIPDAIERRAVSACIEKNRDVFYINEILDLNAELSDKKIYIYGIGNRGDIVYNELLHKGIHVVGVCVTKIDKISNWHGKKVLSIEQFVEGEDSVFIVATDKEYYQKEMLMHLGKFAVEKYLCFFMSDHVIFEGNFFQVINIALLKHNDMWLYSTDDENVIYLSEIFERYQINISKRICYESIFDLEYEVIDRIAVIVAENDDFKTEWVCDTLDKIGYKLEEWNYTATGLYTHKATLQTEVKKDVLIGFSTYESAKYPGYVIYGNEETARIRIMILGGSTSTENIYRTISWVRFFYEKLMEEKFDPIIYNGAVCGHGITDEFLHMIRDIEPLKPDYVISFSGVNNTYCRKTKNQFNIRHAESLLLQDSGCISGIESEETLYDFWCRISKLIQLVAEWHGAKAYTFLQPMSAAKEDLNLIETSLYDYTEHTSNIRLFKYRTMMEKNMFYVNLISMLEDTKAYIDYAHYSSDANKMIADCIYEVLQLDFQKCEDRN